MLRKNVMRLSLILLGLGCFCMLEACTSISPDFSSMDYSSFSTSGTYRGHFALYSGTSIDSTVTSTVTLSQQSANVHGVITSDHALTSAIPVIDDSLAGSIDYYANYHARISGYIFPKSKTLQEAQQDTTAIPIDFTVNTLDGTLDGNVFPTNTQDMIEMLLIKE